MKLLIFLGCLIVSTAVESKPFKIPRSEVVELTEFSTSRVYPVFIKTPRSYESNTNKHYPVIYLTDAPYTFQIASGATRFPMNSGAMEEAIIVGISYSKGAKGPSSRVRDFTISKAQDWKLQTGNAEGHVRFIREEIFSYLKNNYRVSSQRTYVGNSLGGLFGAYIFIKHPSMFDNYIIGSPSVWFNSDELLSIPPNKPTKETRVYIAVGSLERPEFGEGEDMLSGAKALVKKVSSQSPQNVTVEFNVIDGAKHSTAFPTTLIQGLDWIYGK